MKTITTLALALALCAGLASTAFAHGPHGNRGNHGWNNGWHNGGGMRAEGYGGHYRGGGPCWNGNGEYSRQQYTRQDGYRDDARYRDEGARRGEYRDEGHRGDGYRDGRTGW